MRATRILAPGEAHSGRVVDTLILSAAQRDAARGTLTGVNGTPVEFMATMKLRPDDRLVLTDGTLVEIVAEPDALIEIRIREQGELARLAWHLGNRHAPVQVLNNRLRLRRDPRLEEMLARWGVSFTPIEAPFQPEGAAYATASHDHHGDHAHHHHHDHAHDHDHDHDHHHDQDHNHDHGHHHGHAHDHDHHHHDHHHHDHGHDHAHGHDHDHAHRKK